MQPPSFGEWLVPLVLALFAVVTAWAPKMKLRLAISAYAVLTVMAYGAYRYRLHEYEQWKANEYTVVMTSFSGEEIYIPKGGGDSDIKRLGPSYYLKITNRSNRRITIAEMWLQGCGKNGLNLSSADSRLPMALDSTGQFHVYFSPSEVHCQDWFNKGRALLTDGRVIESIKGEIDAQGGMVHLEDIPRKIIRSPNPEDPQSPQSPQSHKRDPRLPLPWPALP